MTAATVTANTHCIFTVTVTGAMLGNFTNTTLAIMSNAGPGNTSSASVTVVSAPIIVKAFGAGSIPMNGTTSLVFSIQNPNLATALTGLQFTDSLPAGLVVANTPGLTNTCGGTATATAGSGTVGLSLGTLAANSSCTIQVNVQGTSPGVKNNSVQVSFAGGGMNSGNASIIVVTAPIIIKVFGAASVPLNGTTSLQFTVQNNDTFSMMHNVAFSDTFPAGLVVATPNGLTGSCPAGTITATAGAASVSLSGATLPPNSQCTFAINVKGIAAGIQTNTTGQVSSTEGGTGGTATSSLHVEGPPTLNTGFSPNPITPGGTSALTFTITNPAANPDNLTGVGFLDTLPVGLTVPNASATVCGGTVTLTSPSGISMTGATVNTNSQCIFAVTVTGTTVGQFTNTTGNIVSTNGGTGNTSSATLAVGSAPGITKVFGAATIVTNATTTLTFTLTNPNTGALNGVAFTDTMPAGLIVATPNGLTNACGGTATATAGSGTISLTGGTVASTGSCTLVVNVQGVALGVQNNITSNVTSTNGGTGSTASASLTVQAPAPTPAPSSLLLLLVSLPAVYWLKRRSDAQIGGS
jgi:hypothetical protein